MNKTPEELFQLLGERLRQAAQIHQGIATVPERINGRIRFMNLLVREAAALSVELENRANGHQPGREG